MVMDLYLIYLYNCTHIYSEFYKLHFIRTEYYYVSNFYSFLSFPNYLNFT